jgi:hypothetical protein
VTDVPDRESLVLAVQRVQHEYAHRFADDEDATLAERIVDVVVLPTLRAVVAQRQVTNHVSGHVTGPVAQARDVAGGVTFP